MTLLRSARETVFQPGPREVRDCGETAVLHRPGGRVQGRHQAAVQPRGGAGVPDQGGGGLLHQAGEQVHRHHQAGVQHSEGETVQD